MGKHKSKNMKDQRLSATTSRKRAFGLDQESGQNLNLNHSAMVATSSQKQEEAPKWKSVRVIKRKFVLDNGEIKHLSEEDTKLVIKGKSKEFVDAWPAGECKKVKVIQKSNVTSVQSQMEENEVNKDGAFPADLIDVSVDAEEEWDFLRGMDEELRLDQCDEEDFEVDEVVTPPLDPTLVKSKTGETVNAKRIVVGKGDDKEDFENFHGNPAFERYLQKRMSKEISGRRDMHGGANKMPNKTPKKGTRQPSPQVKSLSDTTIYVPALQRASHGNALYNVSRLARPDQTDLTNQISDFIQGIRLQSEVRILRDSQLRKTGGVGADSEVLSQTSQPGTSGCNSHIQEVRNKAERIILEAEQHKPVVNTPPGMTTNCLLTSGVGDGINGGVNGVNQTNVLNNNREAPIIAPELQLSGMQEHFSPSNNFLNPNKGMDDDDFFHVSCHVDSVLKGKIQRGEFVEPEKLLPQNRRFNSNESRMELVFRDGKSFFVPAAPDNKNQ